MSVFVQPITAFSFDAWLPLAEGYKAFYQTPLDETAYRDAWDRLASGHVHGLGASTNGELIGIAHYLFHVSTWAASVCYLQDLYVAETARGQGVARQLIEAVATGAKSRGCGRYYWLTRDENTAARALYDKVGEHRGFIRYDYDLSRGVETT